MAEKEEVNLAFAGISAGATPVDPKQNGRPSSAKQGSTSWFSEDVDGPSTIDQGREGHKDREERLRLLKEKQNEDRQRKLDELKQQALAAQKFREQKEEERRRRLEELRIRDTDRRHQVEERKRQIWEAERDRREAILRKNQEREARIESKRKNERSSIVFAFGSSTPRMLEPGDTGSTYWASRRATSTTNVMSLSLAPGPLTRRSSERELDGSKKRATSASCAERKNSQDETDQGGSVVGGRAGRRKTDLVPTIPSPRESSAPSARSKSKGNPGLRSGEVTPSRPQSSMSQHSVASNISAASLRVRAAPRKPRPISIAVTGVSERMSLSAEHRNAKASIVNASEKPPIPKAQVSKKQIVAKPEPPKKTSDKPKPIKGSSSSTPKSTPLQSPVVETEENVTIVEEVKQGDHLAVVIESVTVKTSNTEQEVILEETIVTTEDTSSHLPQKPQSLGEQVDEVLVAAKPAAQDNVQEKLQEPKSSANTPQVNLTPASPAQANQPPVSPAQPPVSPAQPPVSPAQLNQPPVSPQQLNQTPVSPQNISMQSSFDGIDLDSSDMTSSITSKTRITTEEEAKAALAERRRQAREQAEREAELERQRIEAEKRAEEERIRREEEEQRRMEEEQLRLLEEARQAEELRLQQAIEEARKREEEEKKRKEEELRQKIEKEEAEKKAKEEAEKLRQEMELRLKKEEEDRQARRKRVEAIMLRTRGRGSTTTTTPTKDGEEAEESPLDEGKLDNSMKSQNDQFLNSERSHSDANIASLENIKQNGHHNGSVDSVTQNNVTNSLLDLDPVTEPVSQILDLPSGNGKLAETSLQTQFIAFQENKEPATVNDLLS